jgi:hypothetical protein
MLETHAGAGGFEFHRPWGVSVVADLTPPPEDGIAKYSDKELKAMITQGVHPEGKPMMPPTGTVNLADWPNGLRSTAPRSGCQSAGHPRWSP